MAFFNPDDILNKFGLPNYIQNGNFEMYSTFAAQVAGATKWNAYKDAAQATPVDGTGGTATVIRNASVGSGSQLRGTRSWQITKTGNAQGEGYSQDFTIDAADKSRNVGISFDYSAGSAYTTGDMAVYVYDITNATLITPTSVNIPSGSGTFSTVFVTTTSTSYRLIFHCAASNATTTNWSMTVDTVQVNKNTVATDGYAISTNGSGNYTTSSTSDVDVTNLSVTITTTGRPVRLYLIQEDNVNQSFVRIGRTLALASGFIGFVRGATLVTEQVVGLNIDTSATENQVDVWYGPGAIASLDVPSAGTYTYKIQARVNSATATLYFSYCKLVAEEI
jgi:hypothetical protein